MRLAISKSSMRGRVEDGYFHAEEASVIDGTAEALHI